MKSGMIAAESVFDSLKKTAVSECENYSTNVEKSWIKEDLYPARNIHPAMQWGLIPGLMYSALDTYIFRGKTPWTLQHKQADNLSLEKASQANPISYPKHDNQVTFDISNSLFLSNIHYQENQPYHLKLKSRPVAIDINLKLYASPETRYCPAGVYEIFYGDDNNPRLRINGGNCIHCKACDIKDPTQNITWTPSEGGSGPDYEMM
jgi:electron-transferring-flavoprotein dehydrogenase